MILKVPTPGFSIVKTILSPVSGTVPVIVSKSVLLRTPTAKPVEKSPIPTFALNSPSSIFRTPSS